VRTTLYVLDGAGSVERNDDGGQIWTFSGLPAPLDLGQSASGSFYAIDQFGGVWLSRRARQPWRQRSSLATMLDSALVAAQEFPETVFAVDPGSEVLLVGIYTEGLLRSTAGLSFAPPGGVAALNVLQLLHVPAAAGAGEPAVGRTRSWATRARRSGTWSRSP
jgi:hypothetical protein